MPLLQTGSKMSKNAVSREEAANVIDDIYRFLFCHSSFCDSSCSQLMYWSEGPINAVVTCYWHSVVTVLWL